MKAMSFMLTTPQMRAKTKTVTRRVGWANLKPGDRIKAVEKGMGLKKGERQVVIGVIEVVSIRLEPLRCVKGGEVPKGALMFGDFVEPGRREVDAEGFPELSPEQFVEMFCKTHKNCTPESVITRIEFKHVEEEV